LSGPAQTLGRNWSFELDRVGGPLGSARPKRATSSVDTTSSRPRIAPTSSVGVTLRNRGKGCKNSRGGAVGAEAGRGIGRAERSAASRSLVDTERARGVAGWPRSHIDIGALAQGLCERSETQRVCLSSRLGKPGGSRADLGVTSTLGLLPRDCTSGAKRSESASRRYWESQGVTS
jgi:hypothetical protein